MLTLSKIFPESILLNVGFFYVVVTFSVSLDSLASCSAGCAPGASVAVTLPEKPCPREQAIAAHVGGCGAA